MIDPQEVIRVKMLMFCDIEEKRYVPGNEYDLPQHIAEAWLAAGYCEYVTQGD